MNWRLLCQWRVKPQWLRNCSTLYVTAISVACTMMSPIKPLKKTIISDCQHSQRIVLSSTHAKTRARVLGWKESKRVSRVVLCPFTSKLSKRMSLTTTAFSTLFSRLTNRSTFRNQMNRTDCALGLVKSLKRRATIYKATSFSAPLQEAPSQGPKKNFIRHRNQNSKWA